MSDIAVHEKRPKRKWGRVVGWSLLALFAVVVLGHAFWGWYQEKQLAGEVEALRKKGEPVFIDEFKEAAVADEDNAVLLLREAGRLIDQSTEAFKQYYDWELALPLSEKEVGMIERFVEENRRALAKLREARGKKGVDWKLDHSKSPPLGILLPSLGDMQVLSNVASAAMLLEHERGNDREVVEIALDLLAMSDAMEQMPSGIVPHLVGIAMATMAAERLEQIGPDLRVGEKKGEVSAAQVRKLIDKLLDESATRQGQKKGLRMERAVMVQIARSINATNLVMNQGSQQATAAGYLMRPLFVGDGRVMLRHASEIIEAADAKDRGDFQRRAGGAIDRFGKMRQNKAHLLLRILAAPYEVMVERTFRAMTERRLAAVALAVRLYATDHGGAMPASLEELAPKYLPAVPGDPLGDGKKIADVREEARPRIYSVGSNGKDDAGSDEPLRQGPSVDRWSREDLVVDLKRQARKAAEEK